MFSCPTCLFLIWICLWLLPTFNLTWPAGSSGTRSDSSAVQDARQPLPTVRARRAPAQQEPLTATLQRPLGPHAPISTHAGWHKASRPSRKAWDQESSLFWKVPFWCCLLKTWLSRSRTVRVTRVAPGTPGSDWCLWEQAQQAQQGKSAH